MNERTIKIIGYIIYFICLFSIFGIMIKMELIIWSGNFTLVVAALISLFITHLIERLLTKITSKS